MTLDVFPLDCIKEVMNSARPQGIIFVNNLIAVIRVPAIANAKISSLVAFLPTHLDFRFLVEGRRCR